jgi:hypothetical protein
MDYEPYGAMTYHSLYTCGGCGAIVHNMARHDDWHRQVDFDETVGPLDEYRGQ